MSTGATTTTSTTTPLTAGRPASTTAGLLVALLAAASFGFSGPFVKPLLESGWSPVAAVTVRALIGGVVLAPVALVALRGRLGPIWRARRRVLGMAVIGVAGTQVFYFAAVVRIPVGTAILVEYLAPLLLVGVAWATTRRVPQVVVLVGSAIAFAGLLLVVAPGGGVALDPVGLALAGAAMVCCAAYFVIAARPSGDLPPVALAASGLLVGAALLGLLGLTGLVPFTTSAADVPLFDAIVPWWVPMLVVGVVATAVAYATSITASSMLGSRLASFVGLLEVAAAALYAWLLLGEALTPLQLGGGLLIVVGIGFVRAERTREAVVVADAVAETPLADAVAAAPAADTLPAASAAASGSRGAMADPTRAS
ncbi:DMT family transporter [Frigoribacterium sp. Leaf415]|uniref:DMT family transporter n=1 Tax=unclassified Frigoribacterium TaxID=2627005 RepID=UPI0009E9B7F6|nr:DMT family transporter [Frigoribacterium sp. Leaf415]